MPEEIQNAQTTTQATVGSSIGAAVAISIIGLTSPIGVWSIINLFQVLILLILSGAFIPLTVKQYLLGMDFVLFNFDFIPVNKIPFIDALYEWMNFKQQNQNLRDIEVEYGSTFINNISFVFLLLI